MKDKAGCFGYILYLIIGFIQLFAIIEGVKIWFDFNILFSSVIAFFVTYIPILGAIAGVIGAALEWVMAFQSSNTNTSQSKKASGIINDANRYAIETVGDPAYPLTLFQRIITVSLETMKIVKSLPKLEILELD